jgi:hypothetical protein
MELTALIEFMKREIETEKKADQSYDTRERYQLEIIEALERLRGLEK